MTIKETIEKERLESIEEEKRLSEEYDKALANGEIKKEDYIPTITTSEGRKIEPLTIKCRNLQKQSTFTEKEIQEGFKRIENLKKKMNKNKKLLDDLIERTDKLLDELFTKTNATDEQREEYMSFLMSESQLIEDIISDLFEEGKKISGTPQEIIEQLIQELPEENQRQLDELLSNTTLQDDEKKKELNEIFKPLIENDDTQYIIRPKGIDFSTIKDEDLVKILDEQLKLNQETIKGMKESYKIQEEFLQMNGEYSIFTFEGEEIVTDKTISEEGQRLFVKICDEMIHSMDNYQAFTKLTKRKGITKIFSDDFMEEKLLENDEIEELKKKIIEKQQSQSEEILEYTSIATQQKNKLMTTEKIVPQLFLLGDKIKEKISFDLSGDSEDNFIVNCIMEQYPIQFTTGTFQTLESLMTIQNYYEKNNLQIPRNPFTTKDIIYLNKGGKVSKFTNKEIEETNEEIMSLMSAIGKLDITEYMTKYNEQRKDDDKISTSTIKRISAIQNFVNLQGIDIEYNDNKIPNDTMWYFRDTKPIPLFEFIKITGRFQMLPLEMDSYLTDSQTNNEITRTLKNVIANLRYYKNNKNRKQRMWQSFYYEGRLEGQKKDSIFSLKEAMIHIKNKEIVGKWKYQAIRTIDSLAQEMKFDDDRTIGMEKQWKNKMERTRFIDSIVEYLRKAKEDNIISDFKLYSDKEKVFNEEDYITENEQRKQKTKDKMKGIKKDKKSKQKKNPSVYKIAIIIE